MTKSTRKDIGNVAVPQQKHLRTVSACERRHLLPNTVDRIREPLKGLPVIIMSAHGDGGYASTEQIRVSLSEPYAMELLCEEVRNALQTRSGMGWEGAVKCVV